jgi:hypothetical protein
MLPGNRIAAVGAGKAAAPLVVKKQIPLIPSASICGSR